MLGSLTSDIALINTGVPQRRIILTIPLNIYASDPYTSQNTFIPTMTMKKFIINM